MIARYGVEHVMRFDYADAVCASAMTLYLFPARDRAQAVRQFSIHTDPDGPIFEFADPFGNTAHFLDRPREHARLEVRAHFVVEVEPPAPAPECLEPGVREALRRAVETPALWPMANASRFVHPQSPALERFVAARGITPGDDPLVSTRALCAELHDAFDYIPGHTGVDSPIEEILETGQGVCQDYAHVMASILRGWGVPCRYVSGYLGPKEHGTVHGESHAWVECWFPGLGWRGFDPTNDTEVDERHVRVAVGRDYADVPPSRGVFRGGGVCSLTTEVVIERYAEPPA